MTSFDSSPSLRKRKRLAFVISDLGFGGAQRDISKCVNFWAENGAEVCIFVFMTSRELQAYPLDSRVQVYFLKDHFHHIPVAKVGVLLRRIFCIIALRQSLKKFRPNVIISYMDIINITTLIACKGLNVPVIVSERIDPAHHRIWGFAHPLLAKIRLWTYPLAHRVIVQTRESQQYFPDVLQSKITVIPNCVARFDSKMRVRPVVQDILNVGRLASRKDQETLIRAFSLIHQSYPALRLTIYGDGPYRERLERIISSERLQDHVSLSGNITHVQEALLQADLFVFPSRYEGFPNALCEAMAIGLPVIASNCSGNTTVVQDGINGLLFPVGDVQALAQKMRFLIDNLPERQGLSKNARRLPERFPESLNHQLWKEVVDAAINTSRT
jgi:glycosyltransferase involved in cell wall biosynthesis